VTDPLFISLAPQIALILAAASIVFTLARDIYEVDKDASVAPKGTFARRVVYATTLAEITRFLVVVMAKLVFVAEATICIVCAFDLALGRSLSADAIVTIKRIVAGFNLSALFCSALVASLVCIVRHDSIPDTVFSKLWVRTPWGRDESS